MTGTDNAATVEDGSVESALTGGSHGHMSKANQAEIKRRALQAQPKKSVAAADAQFRQLIDAMGPNTLDKPFLREQLDDLRNNDQPDGFHSSTMILAMIAAAKTLPYASDAAMELLAHNSNEEPKPVAPRLELDDVA